MPCKGISIASTALHLCASPTQVCQSDADNWVLRMVRENISSALIMEDDTDWDVRLKSQLIQFAEGARTIQKVSPTTKFDSPYGDDWDVLWVGHCGEALPKEDNEVFVIENDPAVPARKHMKESPFRDRFPEDHTRVIHKAGKPICLLGYALSQRGAQRMLWAMSVSQLRGFIDWELADFCQGKSGMDIKCITIEPALISTHRAAGAMTKDSDNVFPDQLSSQIRQKGTTADIRWSVRLNLLKLLKGETDYEDQFPD